MKKIGILFTTFVMAICCGYAQDTTQINSRKEAITILENNDFFNILRYPADTLGNIDRFIGEINKIIPTDQQKSDSLKEMMFSCIRKEGNRQYQALLYWPIGQTPHVGSNVDEILKNTFSTLEYEKLSEQLSQNLIYSNSAFRYLADIYKTEENLVVLPLIGGSDFVNVIYDYFGI